MSNNSKTRSRPKGAKKRRARGEGSIYRDDRKNRWIAQVYTRSYSGNKKTYKRTRTCVSLHDAQDALRQLRLKYSDNLAFDAERLSTAAWLTKWFEVYSLPYIRPSTAISYRRMVGLAVNSFGAVPLVQLSPLHIQTLINDMTKQGHLRTAQYFAKIMKMAFSQAVKLHLLTESPADALILPKKKAKAEFVPLTEKEREIILNAKTPLNCWKMMMMIEFATGLRRGELLGLKWSDYDAKNQTLTIQRALITGLVEEKSGEFERKTMLSDTKTAASHRKLVLPRQVCYNLNAYRKAQIQARLQSAKTWENPTLIFTKNDGKLIEPDYFSSCFHRAISWTLPKLTFHKLRHDFASRMLNSHEFSPKEIQAQLGHASVKITLDVYAHLDGKSAPKVAKWLENGISGAE